MHKAMFTKKPVQLNELDEFHGLVVVEVDGLDTDSDLRGVDQCSRKLYK